MASIEPPPSIDLGLPGWHLRGWREGDAPALARHADDLAVWRWMNDAFPHPYTLALAQAWVTRGHLEFGGRHWAITRDDAAVGGCGLTPLEGPQRCNAEIGWWLGQAFWGQGVGSRAARALVTQGFSDPSLTRLYATVHAGNTPSMRVAEKAGLQLEGVQRRSVHKAGRIIDRHIYAVVREQ